MRSLLLASAVFLSIPANLLAQSSVPGLKVSPGFEVIEFADGKLETAKKPLPKPVKQEKKPTAEKAAAEKPAVECEAVAETAPQVEVAVEPVAEISVPAEPAAATETIPPAEVPSPS